MRKSISKEFAQGVGSVTSGLILHSYRRCPFAIRVRMVLEEKGLPYRTIEEDLSSPSEELLRLHPEGRVPLLIHGNFVVHESSIITEYLDDAFPSLSLMPQEPQQRAEVRLLTYHCNFIFKADLDIYKYELPKLSTPEAMTLDQRLNEHLTLIERKLQLGPYLLGDTLTLADIHLFPLYRQLSRALPLLKSLENYPRLNGWMERISQRPGFLRAMKKPSTSQ